MNRFLTDLAKKKRGWHVLLGLFSVFLGVIGVQTWIEDSPADENFVIWLLAHATVMCLLLWPLYYVVRWRLRQRDAKAMAARLDGLGQTSIPLDQLDGALGIKNATEKIADLKKKGFLQRLELEDGCLVLDAPGPEQDGERAEPEEDVLQRIRRLNDEIDDEAVSGRIDRIEAVTASILQTLRERPDRARDARRFMNYYLPATLKLLESYRLMEKQSYQGDNIQASRRSIESVLEKLVTAAEQQQDRLFGAEALDVEAEISALETMMTSDGLMTSATPGKRGGL